MGGAGWGRNLTLKSMKRIVLLLLPVFAFAASGGDPEGRKSKEEVLGGIWQESLSKESGGDTDGALALASDYARSGGDGYLATVRAAWLSLKAKRLDDAARHYGNAARMQQGAMSPRLGMLNVAQEKGDLAGIVRAGEAVLALEPTNYKALMAVAYASFQAKDYSRAGSAYRRVMALYPEDVDALSGAGWSAFYKGQKVEARTCFRRLVSMQPDYPYARQGIDAVKN